MGPLPSTLRSFRPQRGFALLLTLTLLAFVVLLLVALATYTRVETAVAGNMQRQAQARENALLGLNVALDQLQKHAGPDTRVTATAAALTGVNVQKRYYTGVWDSTPSDTGPRVWLASGAETTAGIDVTAAIPAARQVALVSTRTDNSTAANSTVAALQDITAPGVPGQVGAARATIGRYAWWVGDQGVKAPVAVPDTLDAIDYAPFVQGGGADARVRIRQQIGLGAGTAFSATGDSIFEPRDSLNAPLVADNKISSFTQFAHLRNPANALLGLTTMRQNFHRWSPNNLAVLADTAEGGLRRDLSVKPDTLGKAFAAWANYDPTFGGYMEDLFQPSSPAPLQPYGADPIRRRYRITERIEDNGIEHRISPILTFFGLSFSVRNDTQNNSPTELILSARCVVGLWNPYSSALVPEDLELVVNGLPEVVVASLGSPARRVNLQRVMENGSGDVKFALNFTPNDIDPDRSSWLPGRVYNWSALSTSGDPGDAGYPTEFYQRDATPTGQGVLRTAGSPVGPNTVFGVQNYRVVEFGEPQTLTIQLRRSTTGEILATFVSPEFEPFFTDPNARTVGALSSDFAYVFRMPDRFEIPSGETNTWLAAPGRDPREYRFPATAQVGFVVPGGPPRPELLVTLSNAGFPASYSHLLLDRWPGGTRDYNEDAPVFELPRSPILSVGMLQHLLLPGERPFTVGNSWGGARNGWFDQFFFSGLAGKPSWNDISTPLPNPLLRVVKRKVDGSTVEPADLMGEDRQADGYSSRYLLQSGAFNVNSVSPEAWIGVVRNVRFADKTPFTYASLDMNTGTTLVTDGDAVTSLNDPWLADSKSATFARFSQSAQETFAAAQGYIQSDPDSSSLNVVNTPLFRRGVRFLGSSQVADLAGKITALMQEKHAASGPFRTLQEFLAPSDLFLGSLGEPVSLLEKAIEDAQLNSDEALGLVSTTVEFSSQWLTQADIMTALAPVLFVRSDTFLIRSYGEAVNPATGATEGRAWCEATVQRVPEYFDSSADAAVVMPDALTSALNLRYGRRFKVISFRWLTRSDI